MLIIPIVGFLSGRLPLAGRTQPVFAAAVWLISLPVVAFGVEGRLADALYERRWCPTISSAAYSCWRGSRSARAIRRLAGPADQNA